MTVCLVNKGRLVAAFGVGAAVFPGVVQNGQARGLGKVTAAALLVVKINK